MGPYVFVLSHIYGYVSRYMVSIHSCVSRDALDPVVGTLHLPTHSILFDNQFRPGSKKLCLV